MGINYYWANLEKLRDVEDKLIFTTYNKPERKIHLGKESSCCFFCYTCNFPLLVNGDTSLAYKGAEYHLEYCPKCGQQKPSPYNGIMKEYRQQGRKQQGIVYVHSFTWAQEKAVIAKLCERFRNEEVIESEDSILYTGQDFMQMLFGVCPIEFFDLIGKEFF